MTAYRLLHASAEVMTAMTAMTAIHATDRPSGGARLLYDQRENISAAAAFILLALLLLGFSQPVAEQIVQLKERIISIELSPQELPVEPTKPKPLAPLPPPLQRAQPRIELRSQTATATPAVAQSTEAVTEPTPRAVTPIAPAQLAAAVPAAPKAPALTGPPVPPSPATTPAPPSSAGQTDRYEAQILRYLESVKRYPSSREARQTRPTGIVTIWFELARSGKVIDAGIEKSSNSSLLDSEALKTVRTSSFPAFPEGVHANADKHRFAAHLSYELKTSD